MGILRDGTYNNWKSEERIIRGGVDTIDIIDNGDDFAINNPPQLRIESPFDGAIGNITKFFNYNFKWSKWNLYCRWVLNIWIWCKIHIVRNASGSIESVTVVDSLPGNDYTVGVSIVIDGYDVGGETEDDDITLAVTMFGLEVHAEAEWSSVDRLRKFILKIVVRGILQTQLL